MVSMQLNERKLWLLSLSLRVIYIILVAVFAEKESSIEWIIIYVYVTLSLSIVMGILLKFVKWIDEDVDQPTTRLSALNIEDLEGYISFIYFGKGFGSNNIDWITETSSVGSLQSWFDIILKQYPNNPDESIKWFLYLSKHVINIDLESWRKIDM